ncbi:MAG: Yop proteins translocation protein K [Planctomycetes bacterium]|nr:Yop proteins translocation protein K [Planctomycetota bacterium]
MTDPALASFRRWRALLDRLAADIHPGRIRNAGLSAGAAAALLADPRARRTLSVHLAWLGGPAATAGDDGAAWRDWTAWESADGAALAPGAELERCGSRLGAALFRDAVVKLVFGRDIAALKAGIGEDAYLFALRQGLLVRPAAALVPPPQGGSLADLIPATGRLGLAAWLRSLPADLAARVVLKLPPPLDAALAETAGWDGDSLHRWQQAMRRVFDLTFGAAG